MSKYVYEMRCVLDDALLCKTIVNSVIEIKCKKCKKFNYFLQGTSYLKDVNNNFKGGD